MSLFESGTKKQSKQVVEIFGEQLPDDAQKKK
jgi:hypothetical protein